MTPTDPEDILSRSAEARRNGYAAAFDEIYHGDASVAAPIIAAGGEVVAAVSMSVPLARMERAQFLETFPRLVITAARGISF